MDDALLRSLTDSLPALISVMTPDGVLESSNGRVLDYFGMTVDELRGWDRNEAVHPEDRAAVVGGWEHSVSTGELFEVEQRMRRADGVYRWFHVRGQPMRAADGRITRWCILSTDIDERKRMEQLAAGEKEVLEMIALGDALPAVLRALCLLFDSVVEGCVSAAVVLDRAHERVQHAIAPGLPAAYYRSLEGRPVSAELGACGLASTSKQQVIVRDVELDQRWQPDGWPARARACGVRSCWSTPVLARTGETLGTFTVHRPDAGTPSEFHRLLTQRFTGLVSLAIQRIHSADALRQNQELLTAAEQLSATGCFAYDLSTGVHWWSPQTYRIFGADAALAPTFELMRGRAHPDDIEVFDRGLNCARRGEDHSMELRLQRPDGTLRYIQVVGRGMRDLTGEVAEYVGAVRDLTELRRSEEALGKARSELAHVARVASLGVLTASIAHEVSQPLSGILTNAKTALLMLSADPPNISGAQDTARRTIRDGNRAFDVIAKLRALFAKRTVTSEAVDLNDAAQEVLTLLRSELQTNRVSVRMQPAPDLPAVRGDRVQLQQVILNLLLNGSDAMSGVEERPRLMFLVTERDGEERVRLTVRDSGVGLDPQAAERLFDAFYTTKSSGMGIGLSVSRSIIESHHGSLWASANQGPGATFAFSIPSVETDTKV